MKRKYGWLMLALLLILTFVVGVAGAEDAEETSGNCGAEGDNLTWELDSSGTLTISGTGDMMDYTPDAPAPWSKYTDTKDIKAIKVEEGVTSIGAYTFRRCDLQDISLPDGITSIGEYAFAGCDLTAISSFELPEKLASIGVGAFYGSNLNSIVIPNGVTSIEAFMFYSAAMSSIELPDGITSIEEYAFYGCNIATRKIDLPEKLTSIGPHAFYSCRLESVVIPKGVTSIEAFTFMASGLTHVELPSGLQSIGSSAFGGAAFREIEIPESVTSIESGAFFLCKDLERIVIPEGVTSISAGLFQECTSLNSVTIPDSITSIGASAFISCESLPRVDLPAGVRSIGYRAFSGCASLKNVNYKGSKAEWASIEISSDNDPLWDAEISCTDGIYEDGPPSVPTTSGECGADGDKLTWTLDSDGTLTISGTGRMKDFTYEPHAPWRNDSAPSVKTVILDDGVTSIGGLAFYKCSDLKNIKFSAGLTSIGYGAFDGCGSLEEINLPEGLTSIGNRAFSDCGLINVDLPDGITSIGESAFSGCRSLTNIDLPAELTSLGSSVFFRCVSLENIVIPNGVTSIEGLLFDGCTGLKNVKLPEKATLLDGLAFCDCSSLKTITLPEGITSIGYATFKGCSSLETVIIPAGVKSIGEEAFSGCASLREIEFPAELTSIKQYAFRDCGKLPSINLCEGFVSFGYGAFEKCISLRDVDYTGSMANWKKISINEHNESVESAFIHCSDGNINGTPNRILQSGNCGDQEFNLRWTLDETGTLTISGAGKMKDYSFNNPAPWQQLSNPAVVKVVIEEWVTNFGNEAFRGCSGLKEISIPDYITSIPTGMFEECSALRNIVIPDSITWISSSAFKDCTSLENIILPDNAFEFQFATFEGCTSLRSITLPKKTGLIFTQVFNGCTNLRDVYYAGSIASWNAIPLGMSNDPLRSATIHCSDGDINGKPETPDDDKPDTPDDSKPDTPDDSKPDTPDDSKPDTPDDSKPDTPPEGESKSIPLPNAVLYVPYICRISEYLETQAELRYELDKGSTLPANLSLNPDTGEISGVPIVRGNFTFRITGSDQIYTLRIRENTESNLKSVNDYKILKNIGTQDGNNPNLFYKSEYSDEHFVIDAPFDDFMRLYIDGVLLVEGSDYTVSEGSTDISIYSQTFRRFGKGVHTIATEFKSRTDSAAPIKRVAQNYTLSQSSSDSGSSPNSGGSSSKPSIRPGSRTDGQEQPSSTVQTDNHFTDVNSESWYYEDVRWAYEQRIMLGTGGRRFDPDGKISQAMIVTVLARLAKVDLTPFENQTEPNIPKGQYYSSSAIWAKRTGLLPENYSFTEPASREQMAIMLTKYLSSMGKDTTLPAQLVVFRDVSEMSSEGNDAFQVLYRYGIFKGIGKKRMNPNGSTTRAQFVSLMHRIYDTT